MDMYTFACNDGHVHTYIRVTNPPYLGDPLVREVALRVDARVVQQVRLRASRVEWSGGKASGGGGEGNPSCQSR